jgi:hypothetical protein
MVLLHDIIQVAVEANLYLAPEWIFLLQIAERLVGRRIAIEVDLLGRSKSVRGQSFGEKARAEESPRSVHNNESTVFPCLSTARYR